jgi:hypothetical protein
VLNWAPPPGEIQANSCFRVEIRFVVDTLGVPERSTVSLISTNDQGFGVAYMALAPDLRYSPARLKGRPVRQVVTFKQKVGISTMLASGSRVGSATPTRSTRC